jgi:hypothetical protein
MIVAYGLSPNLIVMLAAAFIYGISFSAVALVWTNTLQEMVPPDMLGRVSSIDALGSFVLMPIGFALAGVLTDKIGPVQVFLSAAAAPSPKAPCTGAQDRPTATPHGRRIAGPRSTSDGACQRHELRPGSAQTFRDTLRPITPPRMPPHKSGPIARRPSWPDPNARSRRECGRNGPPRRRAGPARPASWRATG